MPPLEAVKVLVSIMMSVSVSNKGKSFEVETRHQQSILSRNNGEIHLHPTPAEDRQKYGADKVGRLVKNMYGTQDASHIWQLDHVNLVCGEHGGFQRGKHSAALFHNPNQDVRVAVHGDDFVCLSDNDDLNTSIVFPDPNTLRKTLEHLDSKIQT